MLFNSLAQKSNAVKSRGFDLKAQKEISSEFEFNEIITTQNYIKIKTTLTKDAHCSVIYSLMCFCYTLKYIFTENGVIDQLCRRNNIRLHNSYSLGVKEL